MIGTINGTEYSTAFWAHTPRSSGLGEHCCYVWEDTATAAPFLFTSLLLVP